MIKKKCLKCGKDFDAEKDTAKYCSTSCRVMYNRNNPKPKKEVLDPAIQAQVIYNSVLEMIGRINYGQAPTLMDGSETNRVKMDEVGLWAEPKPSTKTFQQFMNELSELETEHEYRTKAAEIEASSLTRKQKDLLLINMRTSKF